MNEFFYSKNVYCYVCFSLALSAWVVMAQKRKNLDAICSLLAKRKAVDADTHFKESCDLVVNDLKRIDGHSSLSTNNDNSTTPEFNKSHCGDGVLGDTDSQLISCDNIKVSINYLHTQSSQYECYDAYNITSRSKLTSNCTETPSLSIFVSPSNAICDYTSNVSQGSVSVDSCSHRNSRRKAAKPQCAHRGHEFSDSNMVTFSSCINRQQELLQRVDAACTDASVEREFAYLDYEHCFSTDACNNNTYGVAGCFGMSLLHKVENAGEFCGADSFIPCPLDLSIVKVGGGGVLDDANNNELSKCFCNVETTADVHTDKDSVMCKPDFTSSIKALFMPSVTRVNGSSTFSDHSNAIAKFLQTFDIDTVNAASRVPSEHYLCLNLLRALAIGKQHKNNWFEAMKSISQLGIDLNSDFSVLSTGLSALFQDLLDRHLYNLQRRSCIFQSQVMSSICASAESGQCLFIIPVHIFNILMFCYVCTPH